MARLCMLQREKRRAKLSKKFASKRKELRDILKDPYRTAEEKQEAYRQFANLPRDSNPNRKRNRCLLTGRPRGTYRKFGLGRNKLREMALNGFLPGVIMSSW